jgi:hypothetical protein
MAVGRRKCIAGWGRRFLQKGAVWFYCPSSSIRPARQNGHLPLPKFCAEKETIVSPTWRQPRRCADRAPRRRGSSRGIDLDSLAGPVATDGQRQAMSALARLGSAGHRVDVKVSGGDSCNATIASRSRTCQHRLSQESWRRAADVRRHHGQLVSPGAAGRQERSPRERVGRELQVQRSCCRQLRGPCGLVAE